MLFARAIVRPPGANFDEGLTTAALGAPDYLLARKQHNAYCEALERQGLVLTRLDVDEEHPDSTFVEDTAILTPQCAILSRPGAPTRAGEIKDIETTIRGFFPRVHRIEFPGTFDGGDVCQVENHFFIGISRRTNPEGAKQLASLLEMYEYTSDLIDIRGLPHILHLKSGVAYLGESRLLLVDALIGLREFERYSLVKVPSENEYAANCLRVNDVIFIAAGYDKLDQQLRSLGFSTVALEMSEFQKMDGGLSCLSLRFSP